MFETGKVYRIGAGNTFVPVSFAGVEIGMRVEYASDGGIFTVIGRESSGWTIANGKGEVHTAQQIESLSPYTRIRILENLRAATTEEIEALKEAVSERKDEDDHREKLEAAQKQSDYERILGELKKQYPNAAETGSDYARAAKNLKAELKNAFPSLVFSVRSEAYSGGSSIRIEWTDGATVAQVEEFSSKYEYGKFDGMEDIYNYDSSAYSKAVQEFLGSAKYVSTTRNYSPEVKTAVRTAIAESFAQGELHEYDLENLVYRALAPAEIYGEFTGLDVENCASIARFAPPSTAEAAPVITDRVNLGALEFTCAEFTHTTKQTTCYVATLTSRVERTIFRSLASHAKSLGGYYSKFNGQGAIAGFIFPSTEARELFLTQLK